MSTLVSCEFEVHLSTVDEERKISLNVKYRDDQGRERATGMMEINVQGLNRIKERIDEVLSLCPGNDNEQSHRTAREPRGAVEDALWAQEPSGP